MQKMTRQGGFSLIELLVVLVILGLLAGIVGPKLFGQVDKAKWKTTQTQLAALKGQLDLFRLDVGRYPTTDEGLTALEEKPANAKRWFGPYADGKVPQDAWEVDYHYKSPGDHGGEYDLFSLASDKAEGGEKFAADITSWD